ncbi:MAG: hypothetical protein M8352_09880 [ANME-2 cluster archaeon]|nr:hypothetical protein [ANME-2 cluster archaeon]MDF1532749.1 hypothetical protein [ANME-2 cluster archaeon]
MHLYLPDVRLDFYVIFEALVHIFDGCHVVFLKPRKLLRFGGGGPA